MNAPTVIFLHIPKTAGTTLNSVLYRQYPAERIYTLGPHAQERLREYYQLAPEQKRQYRLIVGHMGYGLHEHIPDAYSYFTILRQPVDRCVSFYYFVQNNPEHYLRHYITDQSWSLADMVRSGVTIMTDNFQTRLLSGAWDKPAYAACTADMLAQAKENLAQRFDVVGLTADFDRTLLLLSRQYGWQNIFYVRQNVTRNRPSVGQIDAETRDLLADYNQLDIALYQYAEELFAERLAAQGAEFEEALRRFQQRNGWYNRYWQPIQRRLERVRRFSTRAYLAQKWGASRSGRDGA